MGIIVEVIIVVGLIGLFVLVFLLNKKTPLPKGVTEEDIKRCEGCQNASCKKRYNKECISSEGDKNEE